MAEMAVLKSIEEMSAWSRATQRAGKSLGFVPTMGALHVGHRSLIERAAKENDAVAVSIFVNPRQFGPGEDFERYPRPFEADCKLCAAAGATAIFAPPAAAMYLEDARTYVEVGGLGDHLCGLSRPGHFRGVATVVTKLLAIVRPDRAYFGKKDAQQLRILEVLVRDLNLGCEVVPCETVREKDGLALSSRNQYLSPQERKAAVCLYQSLQLARKLISGGATKGLEVAGQMATLIEKEPLAEIDYVAVVDPLTLEDVVEITGDVLAAVAVRIGRTRLIDNLTLSVNRTTVARATKRQP